MTSLKKILLAGIAGPLVLAAYSPGWAETSSSGQQASSSIVVAQAEEEERRQRGERRRGERGERGQDPADDEDDEAQDEAESEQESQAETTTAPEAEQAEDEQDLRERMRERRQERVEEERAPEPRQQAEEPAPEPEERAQERQPEPSQLPDEAVEERQDTPAPEQQAEEPLREAPAAEAESGTDGARERGGLRDRLRERGRRERAEEAAPDPRRQAEEPTPEIRQQAEEPAPEPEQQADEQQAEESDAVEDAPQQQQTEEAAPEEEPGIADRLRRMLTGEDDEPEEPVAETPAEPEAERRAGENGDLRERLRQRRQQDRQDVEVDSEAPEAGQRAEEERDREGRGERGRGERDRGDRERAAEDAREPGADAILEAETAEERVRVLEEERRERGDLMERVRERRDRRGGPDARDGRSQRDGRDQRDEIELDREELRDEVRDYRRQREAELEALESESRRDGRGRFQRSGDRVIIRSDNHIFIQNNDFSRFVRHADQVETRQLRGGLTETIVRRPGGIMVVTVRNRFGDIVTRTRILPSGREIVLIDNRRWYQEDRPPEFRIDYYSEVLPPLQVQIPREQYIVETRSATPVQIRQALVAPPVEQVEEAYSLNEVLYNERVRDMVPRIDLDTITFEFDSAEVPDAEVDTLEEIGYALEEIIAENPDEIYLIEGHTDAPGSNEYNLALSDRRAENVAVILTEFFEIPPENLVTQGYGEEYLKIATQAEERQNRRVTIRRITPLMAQAQ